MDVDRLRVIVAEAADGLDSVDPDLILDETLGSCYDGIAQHEVELALVMAARSYVETEPQYSFAASRLLLDQIRREALGRVHGEPRQASQADMTEAYADYFPRYVQVGIDAGHLDPELATFDLDRLAAAIRPERDLDFTFLGLQTLYDRYLLHIDKVRFELPQAFFIRVAMGMALREDDREARAIEFYELLSLVPTSCRSTPTLFNSGTTRPQLSVVLPDHGRRRPGRHLPPASATTPCSPKYSGGLGNDWTPVRGIGANIKGTNGESQGVVPFLKIANDTAVAVNQGGKRKGAVCAYLETWHIDIEEFLDLRKNTGDERRRTHDMNTANWVPDLFLQRVEADGELDPVLPGRGPRPARPVRRGVRRGVHAATRRRPTAARSRCSSGSRAVDLWRRMLTMLFETGHPWITFKDAVQPALAAAARRRGALLEPVHRDHAEHRQSTRSRSATSARSTWPAHVTREGLDAELLARHRDARRSACSTTSST